MNSKPTSPIYPAVLLSAEHGRKSFLQSGVGERGEVTVQLWRFLSRPWRGSLLVDSCGQTFQVTQAILQGINWRLIFHGGPIVGVLVVAIGLIARSIPVRVRFSCAPAPAMDLRQFKSAVLTRIAASTSNFMGRGDAAAWKAPVNTSSSFPEVVHRLSLQ